MLSPSGCVRRKLSALEPATELMSGVPLLATGPPGPVNAVVIPSGVPGALRPRDVRGREG